MVGAGHPERVFTHHAGAAHKNILNGVVEHVAHVEDAGHVWRRNHDGVRLAGIGFGMEKPVGHPVFIPFIFYFSGVVNRC